MLKCLLAHVATDCTQHAATVASAIGQYALLTYPGVQTGCELRGQLAAVRADFHRIVDASVPRRPEEHNEAIDYVLPGYSETYNKDS
jgi:hypothetical protein